MPSQPKTPNFQLPYSTPVQTKRPPNTIKAIRIVNPHPSAPPLPPTCTTIARSRINPGYVYLKDIVEKFERTALPASSGNPHVYAAPYTHTPPMPRCEKNVQNKSHDNLNQDGHTIIKIDPLVHVLEYVFLPHRCDTSTCLERFQEFYNTITPTEWELAATWKYGIEKNFSEMKGIASNLGSDAAVSRAMKRWAERVLGVSLETIFATKILESYGIHGAGQKYALGLSASYKENPQVPVYYPSLQFYTSHSPEYGSDNLSFHTGNLGNVYNPQRTPQSTYISRCIPITRPQMHERPRQVNVLAKNQNTIPATTTISNTDSDRENSTKITGGTKGLKRQQKSNSLNRYISERPHQARHPPRAQNPTPIPNPSGRETPPHKRSPKKKKRISKPENRNRVENTEPTIPKLIQGNKNNIAKLIVNRWAHGNQHTAKKKNILDNFEDTPGTSRMELQISGPNETNFLPLLPTVPLDNKVPDKGSKYDTTRTTMKKLVQSSQILENQESITTKESIWLTNNPQLLRPKQEGEKQKSPPKTLQVNKNPSNEQRNYPKVTPCSSGKNWNQKLPDQTINTSINVTKGPTKSPVTLSRYQSSEPVPKAASVASTKPDYAKAASGANGRNEDSKTLTKAPSLLISSNSASSSSEESWIMAKSLRNDSLRVIPKNSPFTSPPKEPMAILKTNNTKAATWLNEKAEAMKLSSKDNVSHEKGPISSPHKTLISPSSGKSWSSVVTGRIGDVSNIMNQEQKNNAETIEYPELGRTLSTISPNQPPRAHLLKKKTSLSAQAKVFEPASLRYAASFDSYLSTVNTPLPPIPLQTPQPNMYNQSSPSQSQAISTGYDSLLEIFYTTPQFTEYLNKSYDLLLFQQNYLRSQYKRIETVFENEWDMITAEQRKAIVARAIANLSEKVDKVEFWDMAGVEDMLRNLGLATNNSKSNRTSYLRTRAEYCFDLDPDAFAMTPYWLFNIIGWLLGTPPPLRHRLGPGFYNRASSIRDSDYGIEEPLQGYTEFWCPDDCPECAAPEKNAPRTEWAYETQCFMGWNNRSSDSIPGSPMLERFLDEIDPPTSPRKCKSHTSGKTRKPIPAEWLSDNFNTHSKAIPHNSDRQEPYSHPNILTQPRLMSNRFQDPIFKPRSPGWTAAHLGRAQFMEIVEIDISLFYCELIEEILHIFGEIRRERVWYTLPTIWDWYDGPTPSSPQSKYQRCGARPRSKNKRPGNSIKRSMSCPTWGSKELSQLNQDSRWARREGKFEELKRNVEVERNRVRNFVRETQRTVDWVGAGLRLVERETDREVERAWDGGLWTVPVPKEEKAALEEIFSKYCVWRG